MHKIFFTTYYQHLNIYNNFFDDQPISALTTNKVTIRNNLENSKDDLWSVEIYLPGNQLDSGLAVKLKQLASDENLALMDYKIDEEIDENSDWQEHYNSTIKPIEIGNFFISAKIHQNICPIGKTGIYLDASRAFGTGDHETTKGCIEALLNLSDKKINNVLDIGTGSGILSLVAKKLWPDSLIYACDNDPIAVNIAKENAEFNQLEINFFQNTDFISQDLKQQFDQKDPTYDLITSNILLAPLIMFAPEIRKLCTPRGYVVLSGLLQNQLDELLAVYTNLGFTKDNLIIENNWVILTLSLTSK